MFAFVGRRLLALVMILIALAATVFVLQHISPLDPVRAQLGAQASAQAVTARRHELGLDQPLTTQFVSYLHNLAVGDFGTSFRTRRSVMSDLGAYVPATVELTIVAVVLALLLAALFAFCSVQRWWGARLFRGILLVGSTAPVFLLGILGIVVFYQKLGVFPAGGRTSVLDAPAGPTGFLLIDGILAGRADVVGDAFMHLVMPATAIALAPAVAIGRVLGSRMQAEQRSEYARTARAKGLTEPAILRRHILRNTVGSALSMTGLQVGLMFAGVLVVEQVFGWPGIGQYVADSIPVADFPAIGGVTLLLGVSYVVLNALVDIGQAIADPRLTA